jgi:hypothetical protein
VAVRTLSGQGAFDERRNTSQVRPVPFAAVQAYERGRAKYQRERPAWYVWIEQGCPELTPEEYERQGGQHAPARRRGRR